MKWERVKLGLLCKMNSGGTPRRNIRKYYGGTIPWAKIGDIENAQNGYIKVTDEYITNEGLDAIGNKLFPAGTLLLAMYGSVGKTAFAGVPLSTNQAILGVKVLDESMLNVRYLKYWFDSIKNKLLDRAVGGTLQNISLGIVKELEIPLPPLHIQEQIADTLDKTDALRRKDQELLQKYDELAQAIFYDMFGDPVRNERGWIFKSLKDCVLNKAGIKAGPFGSSLKKEFYTQSGYKIYGQEQVIADDLNSGSYFISEEKYRELESCKVEAGDVLISMVGTFGKISVVPDEFTPGIINPRLVKISLDKRKLLPHFFKYVFKMPESKRALSTLTRGGTMDIINAGILKDFSTIIPPIFLQEIFLLRLSKLDRAYILKSKQQTDNLFNLLLGKVFS